MLDLVYASALQSATYMVSGMHEKMAGSSSVFAQHRAAGLVRWLVAASLPSEHAGLHAESVSGRCCRLKCKRTSKVLLCLLTVSAAC